MARMRHAPIPPSPPPGPINAASQAQYAQDLAEHKQAQQRWLDQCNDDLDAAKANDKKVNDLAKKEQDTRKAWIKEHKDNVGKIGSAFVGLGNTLRGAANSLGGLFSGRSGSLGQIGAELQGPLRLLAGVANLVSSALSGLGNITKSLLVVLSGVGSIFKSVISVASVVVQTFLAMGAIVAIGVTAVVGFLGVILAAIPVIGGMGEAIANIAGSLLSTLGGLLGSLLQGVITGIADAFKSLFEGLLKVFEGLITAALDLGKSLVEMSYQILQIILDLTGFIDQLVKGRRAYAIWNEALFSSFIALTYARFGRQQALAGATGNSGAQLVAALNNLEQAFQPLLISLVNVMNRVGTTVAQKITDLVTWISPAITRFLNGIDFTNKDFIDRINKWLDDAGIALRGWIIDLDKILNDALFDLLTYVNTIIDSINGLIDGFNFVVDAINLLIKAIYLTSPLTAFLDPPQAKHAKPLGKIDPFLGNPFGPIQLPKPMLPDNPLKVAPPAPAPLAPPPVNWGNLPQPRNPGGFAGRGGAGRWDRGGRGGLP